jgi:acyl dehydratase
MRRSCTEVEWFEDYRIGDEFLGEPVLFSEKEIVDFARMYDPQSFHIDPVAARTSPFGGLIASGIHSFAAVWGGMMRAGFLNGHGAGAPGIEIEWLKPVHPGDTLTMVTQVIETRVSRSRPDRGFVSFQSRVTNQSEEDVMTLSFKAMIRTRPKQRPRNAPEER